MKNKLFSLCLTFLLGFIFHPLVYAQTSKGDIYNANLLVKKTTGIESKSILITTESGSLIISGGKDRNLDKTISYAAIQSANYTYSDKPQVKEAVILGMLAGNYFGAAMLFSKIKKHWLVLNTATEIIYLELPQNNYRQFLFELDSNGVFLSDSGDRDSKKQPRPKPPFNFTEGFMCGDELTNSEENE